MTGGSPQNYLACEWPLWLDIYQLACVTADSPQNYLKGHCQCGSTALTPGKWKLIAHKITRVVNDHCDSTTVNWSVTADSPQNYCPTLVIVRPLHIPSCSLLSHGDHYRCQLNSKNLTPPTWLHWLASIFLLQRCRRALPQGCRSNTSWKYILNKIKMGKHFWKHQM